MQFAYPKHRWVCQSARNVWNEISTIILCSGALDDFDAANQAKNPSGDVDPSEDTANLEMWREKLAA